MRATTIRSLLALTAFVLAIQWSRPAAADVTITGTVGEIGIVQLNFFNQTVEAVRFKFTDATQTATCTDQTQNQSGGTLKYAFALSGDAGFKEWYAALLVSKKGAPLSCTVPSAQNCHIVGCTLP